MWSGTATFTYRANDGTSDSANVATVTITVDPVNDPPVALDDATTTPRNTAVTIDVIANDSDLDFDLEPSLPALEVSAVAQGANGTAAITSTTEVVYTPALNFQGIDRFTYTYTWRGLLVEIESKDDGERVIYRYDATGRR